MWWCFLPCLCPRPWGLSLLWPNPTILRASLGLLVGVSTVSIPFLIYRQEMGKGDVKLGGGSSASWSGYHNVLVALLLAVVGGGLIASLLLVLRINGRKDAIPLWPIHGRRSPDYAALE
jgi:Flp pilus assembly protein protease CpaA